jgi:hypothetical protein
VLDCLKPMTHKRLIEKELEGFGIRLNKTPPAINFRKKDKGGINFTSMVPDPQLDLEGQCQGSLPLLSPQRPCLLAAHAEGSGRAAPG